MHNQEKRFIYVGLAISAISLFLVFLPSLIGMDMMDGGFALIFVSIALIMPAGITTAVLYMIRARTLQKILDKKDLLAHWRYTREEWETYTEEERKREHHDKISLWYLVIGITAIVFIGFILIMPDKEAALISFVPIIATIILIRVLIFLTGRNTYCDNKKALGESYIGRAGVLVNKSFHSWNVLSGIESARVRGDFLEIRYWSWARQGRNLFTVRVPIPKGKEKEAGRVATILAGASDSPLVIS